MFLGFELLVDFDEVEFSTCEHAVLMSVCMVKVMVWPKAQQRLQSPVYISIEHPLTYKHAVLMSVCMVKVMVWPKAQQISTMPRIH
jgi:hypothetical protein